MALTVNAIKSEDKIEISIKETDENGVVKQDCKYTIRDSSIKFPQFNKMTEKEIEEMFLNDLKETVES